MPLLVEKQIRSERKEEAEEMERRSTREENEEMAGGDDNQQKRSGWSTTKWIFLHADAVDKFLMALGLIGAIVDGFIGPLIVVVTSRLMNNIGFPSDSSSHSFQTNINHNAVALLYVASGAFVACFLEGYCWTRTAERQTARIRAQYLRAVLRQEISYFDLHVTSTSQVITSVSKDTLVIQDLLSEKMPNFLMNTATFIGCYITAVILFWKLAVVGLPFVVLLLIPGLLYSKTLMGLKRETMKCYEKAGIVAEQTISSIRTVHAFVGENKAISKYSSALERTVKLGLKQGFFKGLAIGSNGISFAIWSFIAWYGSRMVMYHGAQGGTVFAVGASIASGGISMGSSLSHIEYFSEACAAAERIIYIINRVPEIDWADLEGQVLDDISGEVEFKNVQFAYRSRPETMVLNNLNLRIPARKTVAVIGESGSGKSTLIYLLERFYNPTGGAIFVDGVGVEKLQLKWLRSHIGLVSQEPTLFATSIKENILFGNEVATMEEVVEAAQASNAHNFISQFLEGYETQVGERGVQLSGGQKQRIAIARAIIKRPRILLLDEATSALDSESERIVQEALDKAAVGRTTIIIAHRLSTIRNADIIAVFQNGQVIEMGSHDELIQHENGLYTSLLRLQLTEKHKSPPAVSISNVDKSSSSRRLSRSNPANSPVSDAGEEDRRVPSLGRLLALNLPEWKQAILGCTGAVLYGAVQPEFAFSLGTLVSIYFVKNHELIKEKTRIYALCFVGLALFSLVTSIILHYHFAYMGELLTKRIREMMLSKILTFEIGWFDQDEHSSGAICSRLSTDANAVRSLVGDRMTLVVQTISAITIAFTIGLVIAWKIALAMIAVQPLIILCYYARRVLLKNMSEKAIKAQEQSSKLAAEAVSNVRMITAFSSQERILRMLEEVQEGPRRENVKQAWYAGIGLGCARSVTVCSWALPFWYGGKIVAEGQTTAKALFQTFYVLISTGRIIADAGSMTSDLAKGSDAVGSVFDVLDRSTKIEPNDAEGYKPDKITGRIDIHSVDFAYPSRPKTMIFHGFSISIEAGKSTALVGQSGSGKSTIIGLIERFYDPIKGTVCIDGRDIRSYHLRTLRKHIALVSQEPTLFVGTIRDNIVYGHSEEVDESEIVEAARAANAHDFISGLSDGYETWCGERGLQLSGGQKQRIAIARAILKNPAVLLLNEATSALDSRSENEVQEALEQLMVGRTSVVVAHRLTTIQNCATVVVLEKGKVVEMGTHLELLEKGESGAYYSLVSVQSGAN